MSIQTIAFLGASGGCAGYCLVSALNDGHKCRALARNPDKLLTTLREKSVSDATLSKLHIEKGDAKNVENVKKLLSTTDSSSGDIVDAIVFGVGAAPKMRLHPIPFTLDDIEVCRSAMKTLLDALAELKSQIKPRLFAVSTTGITRGPRDVPLAYVALYRWALHVPHVDKVVMEDYLWKEKEKSKEERVIGDFTIVRATLLVDGDGRGIENVRAGTDDAPAVGYTIQRKDVGIWMYEKCVKPQDLGAYKDNAVAITY